MGQCRLERSDRRAALIAYLDNTHASQGVHLASAPSTSPFPEKPRQLDATRQTVQSDASRLGLSELWAYMRADV